MEQEARDTAAGKGSGGEENKGEEVGGGDTEESTTEEELLGPNCPMLVGPSEDGGLMVNPRLKINQSGHDYLRQWGIAVDENGKGRRVEVTKISQVRVMLPTSPQTMNKIQQQTVRLVTKGIHKT